MLCPLRCALKSKSFARGLASKRKLSWGMALDIDGVIIRGNQLIPRSDEAIRLLQSEGIPHIFLTNGGGVTEAKKTKQLSAILGEHGIREEQMLLSHTPMRSLAEKFRGRRVLIVGGAETTDVARAYGFDVDGGMAVTASQLAAGVPGLWPLFKGTHGHPIDPNQPGSAPIEAILIFFEPLDWGLELQVICDILAGGVPLGSGVAPNCEQAAEVYVSNPDFLWKAGYSVPRFGQAAFTESMQALWSRLTRGSKLKITEFGKPNQVQYKLAEEMIQAQAGGITLERLYGVGDNPEADVRGANAAGEKWRSILVCTGVYDGGVSANDALDPAWRVESDLYTAVQNLLNMERIHAE